MEEKRTHGAFVLTLMPDNILIFVGMGTVRTETDLIGPDIRYFTSEAGTVYAEGEVWIVPYFTALEMVASWRTELVRPGALIRVPEMSMLVFNNG